MHLYDAAVIGIWLVVVYAISAATDAGDPGFGQLSFFIVGVVLTFALRKLKFEHTIGLEKKEQQLLDSMKEQAEVREMAQDYDSAIEIWERLGEIDEAARVRKLKDKEKKILANEREKARDYESAIKIWESLGEIEEAARVRKLKAEQGAVKVDQTVVQGDQITKTEIKDSVLNRSSIGGKSSKAEELREAKSLFEEGLIDEDEFKQMKKEILGK